MTIRSPGSTPLAEGRRRKRSGPCLEVRWRTPTATSSRWLGLLAAVGLAACAERPIPDAIAYAPRPDLVAPSPPARVAPPESEIDCLAKTIYFEARGEPQSGQRAVAAVVLNRVRSPDFPDTVCAVVHQGGEDTPDCQFSWWCDGLSDEPRDRKAWKKAQAIARVMLAGAKDPTHGALYFHHIRIRPYWSASLDRTTRIGRHIYYR